MSQSKHEIKQLRRVKREAKINRKEQARQNNLKKHWAIWRQNFGDDETAMVEGLFACESLSRNIACLISRQSYYYHYFKLDDDNDLSRLCHFNELKNLWLKRNRNNIVETTKLSFTKNSDYFTADADYGGQETFMSYLDSVQTYFHQLVLADKKYEFISDKAWGKVAKIDRPLVYAKSLSDSSKDEILQQKNFIFTFDSLVLAIEYGCQAFWKENWLKK